MSGKGETRPLILILQILLLLGLLYFMTTVLGR